MNKGRNISNHCCRFLGANTLFEFLVLVSFQFKKQNSIKGKL